MRPARAIVVVALALAAATAPAALGATSTAFAASTASAATVAPAPLAAPSPAPRTTLPAVESQVMCVTCKISLLVAQSPQADRERAFIARLIATGLTDAQVKRALVREYGPAVLALPSSHGFDLAVYVVPPCVVVSVLIAIALLLPRWRRRARAASGVGDGLGGMGGAPHPLSPDDDARLDADMARFR